MQTLNNFLFFSLVLLASAWGSRCKAQTLAAAGEKGADEGFALGADISWVTEMEARGDRFYNAEGAETDCFALMQQLGLNAIRLRVWVDPSATGGWCDKQDLLAKARRAAEIGMDVMVDFHYSDWWADPGKQNIPAAWSDFSYEQMQEAVAAHTREVLGLLLENGVTPKWVQVGNETSNGLLWPMGKAKEHPEQYAGLFAAGAAAVKEASPQSIVIVHLDNGFDPKLYDWNLGILKENGAQWDMIGMSLYPYWAMQSGKESSPEAIITDCMANIRRLSGLYGCDVMIVETGMECADDKGELASDPVLEAGRAQLARIIREAREETDGHCKGVFYWEPECKPGQYRLGAFTADGKPTVIMEAFGE